MRFPTTLALLGFFLYFSALPLYFALHAFCCFFCSLLFFSGFACVIRVFQIQIFCFLIFIFHASEQDQNSEEVVAELQLRHPLSSPNENFQDLPASVDNPPVVTAAKVKHAILSFVNGSAAGTNGLKPQHLKDKIACPTNAGVRLCGATGDLLTLMIFKQKPEKIAETFYGAVLTDYRKMMEEYGQLR